MTFLTCYKVAEQADSFASVPDGQYFEVVGLQTIEIAIKDSMEFENVDPTLSRSIVLRHG